MSEDELKDVKDTITDYLAKWWIQLSTSLYRASVIVIHKKTGELCIVTDYYILKKQTYIDSYQIPLIDDLLNRLFREYFFTKIDLPSGYHQVKMKKGHEYKTVFTTQYGTYEWLLLPLYLTNALSTFQKLMNSIFSDMLDESLLVNLDDLLVFSTDIESYYDDMRKTL